MSEVKHVLRVENVTMQFGGVVAVNNLSMEVNEGEIVALIGPNGTGKSTIGRILERRAQGVGSLRLQRPCAGAHSR